MLCAKPYIQTPTGVKLAQVVLSESGRQAATPFRCGQCLPCRITKAMNWSARIMLEASCYDENAFVTLTYNDSFLPDHDSLDPADLTNYIKRLRRNLEPKTIRYFAVGEYGDEHNRPHYHLCLFDCGPVDYKAIAKAWTEKTAEGRNEMGRVHVGTVCQASANYICGYVVKKLTNGNDKNVQLLLGGRHPEFARMSRMEGGIGLPAVKKLSDKLKKLPYFEAQSIPSLLSGKRSMLLGSYLTTKLIEEMGLDDEVKAAEIWKWQQDIFDKTIPQGGTYFDEVLKMDAGKRKSKVKRHKLFQGQRIL